MKILGVDPGVISTGYGLIQHDAYGNKLLEVGTINPKADDYIYRRIFKVYKNLNDIVTQYKPDVMVLEKIYSHHRHPMSAHLLGHVRGVICLLSVQKNIKLEERSVKRIRKSITGNGGATKEQTKRMVAHILDIKADKLSNDASDALALALGYTRIKSKVQ